MNSSVVLILLVVIFMLGVGTVLFVKPMRNMIVSAVENKKAGLYKNPEFERQMRRLNTIRWVTIAAQIILLGIALLLVARPSTIGSTIGLIAIVVLFGISFVVRGRTEGTILRLRTRGLKE